MKKSGYYQQRTPYGLSNFAARLATIAARNAGRYALRQLKDYAVKSVTKTSTDSSRPFKRGKRQISGVSAKSMGKLKTSPLYGRKNRRYLRRKAVLGGTTTVYETGGIVQSDAAGELVYVGHGTPVYLLYQSAWWTVLRALFIKAGIAIGNAYPATVLSTLDLRNGDVINVRYRASGVSALSTTSYTVVNTDTVNTIINAFASNANWENVVLGNSIEFYDMQFVPNVVITSPNSKAVLKLDGCVLHFDTKSDLKIQNRTQSVSATAQPDETDLNNCPLYGKSYEGSGMGPMLKGQEAGVGLMSAISFKANNATGLIQAIPSATGSTDVGIREPLDYQIFTPVSKVGKIHLDPGQIKTSVISKKIHMNFSKFVNYVLPELADTSTASGARTSNGRVANYRMFALEKMLDANTTATPTAVIVAVENNVRVFCTAKFKNSNPTLIRFLKTRLQAS